MSTHAQSAPDATIGDALRNLASRAGTIFVGQVIEIKPKSGVVEVTFRVDRLVQGKAGGSYTLREWAGLWSNGQPRYMPGQRAMVFLHAPSSAGISTPVDGMEGIVPVGAPTADVAPMLDVRWLATRVQRSVGAPLLATTVSLEDAVAAVECACEPRPFRPPLQPRPALVLRSPIIPRAVQISPSTSPAQRSPKILVQAVPNVR